MLRSASLLQGVPWHFVLSISAGLISLVLSLRDGNDHQVSLSVTGGGKTLHLSDERFTRPDNSTQSHNESVVGQPKTQTAEQLRKEHTELQEEKKQLLQDKSELLKEQKIQESDKQVAETDPTKAQDAKQVAETNLMTGQDAKDVQPNKQIAEVSHAQAQNADGQQLHPGEQVAEETVAEVSHTKAVDAEVQQPRQEVAEVKHTEEAGAEGQHPREKVAEVNRTKEINTTGELKFNITGEWLLTDSESGSQFFYTMTQTTHDSFTGLQLGGGKISEGKIDGDFVSWIRNEIKITARLTSDSQMVDGSYSNSKTGEKLGSFIGKRKELGVDIEKPTTTDEAEPKAITRDYSTEPAWAWWYNPFRKFSSARSKLKDDTECPDPSTKFKSFLASHTKGEVAMCVLRWNMLKTCRIPDDKSVCTICKTSDLNTTMVERLEKCNIRLPIIFAKVYLLYPGIALAVLCLLSLPFSRIFQKLMTKHQVQQVIFDYIGTPTTPPKKLTFRVYLMSLQIAASALNVFVFCVLNFYESMAPPWVSTATSVLSPSWNGWLQFIMNIQMMVNYIVLWMKSGFTMSALLTPDAIIDVLTVGQTLMRQAFYRPQKLAPGFWADPEKDWFIVARPKMNVHFLRSYRCLSALLEIQAMGALHGASAVQQQLMKSGLRLWALVTICTGAMILLEWIGHDLNLNNETPGMRNIGECGIEEGLDGNIACIPFVVGIYWVFTTISTVGYGDFGPHSALTYALVIVIIVAGVTFFSVESQTLMDVIAMENWGLGAAQVSGAHVVLTGGAMRDVDTQVIYPFMQQIFHRSVIELGGKWPEVVLLGQVEDPDLVNDFIDAQLTPAMKKKVKFCNGDPLTPAGIEQAKVEKAVIVYILPSSTTSSMDREDEYNTHVALSVKSLSRTAFRLVLFRSISLKFAMTSGIHPGQCLCLNHFRTSVLLQSSRVRGWQLFLLLMMTNTNWYREGAKEYCRNALLPDEYVGTLANSVFGFGLSRYAAGKPFAELAGYIYRETGAIAFSVQLEGRVVSFPFHEVINPNSVIFCIHKRDPRLAKKGDQIVAPIDWQSHFAMQRYKHTPKLIGTEDLGQELQYLLTNLDPDTEDVVNEQEMKVMREKANLMRAKKVEFMLLVMTRGGETIWPMLYLYLKKYVVSFGDGNDLTKVASGLIILCAEPPPRSMVEVVDALNPEVDISFVVGNWRFPDTLRDAGAEQCKVLLCFPIKAELTTDPESDARIFFILRLLGQLKLRPECLVLYELSSGISGAHVLPQPGNDRDVAQTAISFHDEAFYPSIAAGEIFVPRTFLGMMAKAFYTSGVLEAVNSLIHDTPNFNAVRPEQISLPHVLEGSTFGDCFFALVEGRVGPCPALLLGLLRETLHADCALLNPAPDMTMQNTDLLIILCNGHWVMWAQEQGLRCLGGREQRIDQVDLVKSFNKYVPSKPSAASPPLPPRFSSAAAAADDDAEL
mmetsp:Transcript_29111/g.53590  ORF Transcript_29111/g.53590 Transcript_29111/m.53590 type:complete len:1462 (-) Transcript_29111:96-4481(-)